tara:strand:- start:42 stop:1517 length:1476 start_codon:yes stop_codon:yes gene_type:complete
MNIIQIQDRLKGVDDNALVRYVEQPTSDVPTYLALGELQRREKMRASYQAEAAPTETVSEEIVGKATPQMGIGALTNNMAAPQMPQPEVMSESETITDTGIANLPAPNIGNYAEGGIVGGERDIYDVIIDDYIGPGLDTAGLFAGKYAGPIIGGMWPGEVQAAEKYTPEEMQGIMGYAPGGMVEGLRNSINNPSTLMPGYYLPNRYSKDELPGFLDDPFKIFMGDPQPVEENGDFISEYLGYGEKARKALADKEALEKEAAKPKSQVPSAPVAETKKETTMADRIAEFKSLMGEDKYNDMLVKKMEKMDASAERQAEVAPWMALTEAGLAIAAGQDQNALTNIASGATKGIESYSNSLKEKRALEEQQFEVATKLRQAERAEQIAAIQYGVDSKQFEDTQANKLALANQDAQIKMVLKQMADPGDRVKAMESDIVQAEVAAWEKAMIKDKGDNVIYDPNYAEAKQQVLDNAAAKALTAGTQRGGLTYVGSR